MLARAGQEELADSIHHQLQVQALMGEEDASGLSSLRGFSADQREAWRRLAPILTLLDQREKSA